MELWKCQNILVFSVESFYSNELFLRNRNICYVFLDFGED